MFSFKSSLDERSSYESPHGTQSQLRQIILGSLIGASVFILNISVILSLVIKSMDSPILPLLIIFKME